MRDGGELLQQCAALPAHGAVPLLRLHVPDVAVDVRQRGALPAQYVSARIFDAAHTKIRNHCVLDIDRYLEKNMDAPFALSTRYMVCPDYLHRATNMDYCPSLLTCSPGYVLCDDNTCRKNSTLCPVTRVCPKYTCPFGNCVDDYALCFSNTICKKGYRLCSDRLCHPRSRDCPSYIDDAHAAALQSGMKLCRSGDIVRRES